MDSEENNLSEPSDDSTTPINISCDFDDWLSDGNDVTLNTTVYEKWEWEEPERCKKDKTIAQKVEHKSDKDERKDSGDTAKYEENICEGKDINKSEEISEESNEMAKTPKESIEETEVTSGKSDPETSSTVAKSCRCSCIYFRAEDDVEEAVTDEDDMDDLAKSFKKLAM